MKQLTANQAAAVYKSGEWKDWTDEEKVKFQLYQDNGCMPVEEFHGALEKILNRRVLNGEFIDMQLLRAEYEKQRPSPTFEEIMKIIPGNKRVHRLK
jgi:hypothetical protein